MAQSCPLSPQALGCGAVGVWDPAPPAAPFPSFPPCAFSLRAAFRAVWSGEVCGTMSSLGLGTIHTPVVRELAQKGRKALGTGASECSQTRKILQEDALHSSAAGL